MAHYSAGQVLTAGQVNTIAHQGIQLIEEKILTSSQGSVTFSSIPQQFRHLRLVLTGGTTTSDSQVALRFNGDSSATSYTDVVYIQRADGTTDGTSLRAGNGYLEASFFSSDSIINAGELNILGYSRTDRDKLSYGHSVSGIQSGSNTNAIFNNMQSWWKSTAAVTDIDLTPTASTQFVSGSIFQLFGLGDTSA